MTTIADPTALIEFLEARNLQKDMVLHELKRVSQENNAVIKERDELQARLKEAEIEATAAFDEAAGLGKDVNIKEADANAGKTQDVERKEPARSQKAQLPPSEDETFFSFETELPRLETEIEVQKAELERQMERIEELSEENAALRQSQKELKTSNMSSNTPEQTDIDSLREELAQTKRRLGEAARARDVAEADVKQAHEVLADTKGAVRDMEQQLKTYSANATSDQKQATVEASTGSRPEHGETVSVSGNERSEQLQLLQSQVSKLEAAQTESQELRSESEAKCRTLELEVQRLELEGNMKGDTITNLRSQENAHKDLQGRCEQLRRDRDEAFQNAEMKKTGLEAAVASLRSQLQRTEKDRDQIYQLVLQSAQPESHDPATELGAKSQGTLSVSAGDVAVQSRAPEGPTTLSADGEAPSVGESKKKNKKKKSKAKKAQASTPDAAQAADSAQLGPTSGDIIGPTVEELLEDPKKAKELFRNRRDDDLFLDFVRQSMERIQADRHQESEEHQTLLRTLDSKLASRDGTIREQAQKILEKDAELGQLRTQIDDYDREVAKLEAKLKGEDTLRDEIDDLRDSMTELATETTNAKHALKEEKSGRMRAVKQTEALEKELSDLRKRFEAQKELVETATQKKADNVSGEETQKLRERIFELEKDLAAANQLAQARFKDNTQLREHSNKMQLDLKKAREEATAMRETQAELDKMTTALRKLEGREKELANEIKACRTQLSSRGGEIKALKQRAQKGEERASALEDTYERVRRDLEASEKTRDDAVEARQKAQASGKRLEEELKAARTKIGELERQVSAFVNEARGWKEEVEALTKKIANSKEAMEGSQDQQREMAMREREVRAENEELREELEDARRLLSERGREGETMRRLVSDVEARAEGKVREMRERMNRAEEERDRAEEEASGSGRKKAREVEELKQKLRDAEAESMRMVKAKEKMEKRERESKSRREELEKRLDSVEKDADERTGSIQSLREALEESERQSRLLEKERSDLRRAKEETQTRWEKLQKSSKAMAEELRLLQNSQKAKIPNTRLSMDVSRVASPASPSPRSVSRAGITTNGGQAEGEMLPQHYVKATMMGFLEQKDKRLQMQLVPAMGRLLGCDA